MKKFAIPALIAILIVAYLTAPTLANAMPAPAAMPVKTASPRDWTKYAPNDELDPAKIVADSAVLIDAQSGKVLFAKDKDKQRFPASITKIMTCLLAVEAVEKGDYNLSTPVTVGKLPDMQSDATNIKLKNGETLTLGDLLYGLMNQSGNDAANAIAIFISGSVDTFVEAMNAKAKELGMNGTHYGNPNGLHASDHYTTAYDMALLTMEAEKHPTFCKIVSTYTYKCPKTNKQERAPWVNHNKLIWPNNTYSYAYATGVKTGFTNEALSTLVTSAQKDGQQLIAVVMHDGTEQKWTDSITLFEYGFKFFDTVDILQLLKNSEQSFSLQVKAAAGSDPGMGKLSLLLKPQSTKAFITDRRAVISGIKSDPASQITSQVTYSKDTAPIKLNDVVGTVTFSYSNSPVLVCDLLASRDVAEMPTSAPSPSAAASAGKAGSSGKTAAPGSSAGATNQAGGIGPAFVFVGVVLLLLVLAFVAIRFINIRRRNRKYRQYNIRQGGTKFRR